MKKIFILFMLLCICGCTNMDSTKEEDVVDKKIQSEEKPKEMIKELNPYTFTSSKDITFSALKGYLCDENGEQISDINLNPDENGIIKTKMVFDIECGQLTSIQGLLFVNVDDKIVPSTIMNGKEMDMHYISVPTKESMVDVSVNLKDIDLSYNHNINFYFVNASDNMHLVMNLYKYIETEDNKSKSKYMKDVPYIQETNDAFMKKQIDGYKSEDYNIINSNLYQMKYQDVFDYGNIFPLTADDNILKQADEEGRELTQEEMEKFNFKYEKGKNLDFEILYKSVSEGQLKSGMILVWCNGKWATFDDKQALIYRQSENGCTKATGSIQLPDKPGKYELWYLNLGLNGGNNQPFARKHIINIE